MKILATLIAACWLAGILAACGGGSGGSTPSTPSSGTPTGVATPSKVSVANTK